MDSETMIKLLKKNGWELDSIVGSHHHFEKKNQKGAGKVTVPHPRKDLGFLEKKIRKQAGL
ncbi:type II toxin-antitoxin system HicA family toxin [Glaesserella parasuis]|uniref:Type II toxin-antitoxin system HicA family toxin n=2 Tax=Glaesserella parasuis TaxID=738 RepID=A0A1T0AB85_GLAPU|nr:MULTISPECIES: type II toxin-antitoxin system HicA family toxin [Pasteurellaceae]EQA03600.1 ycfA-like family protein [Glaesserella parasuis SW114]EQA13055.1 ycfA-like family protein [Glaesserella parasuis 174]ATW43322.1 addiction module toxin, HicA family [Glaesserella parasuis D74]AWY45425.1 addiction module toxin, HicA family [Glaesserella parasuis 29755]EQA10786.1 ycfA-like family protein [Glaesserella parasuis D74]